MCVKVPNIKAMLFFIALVFPGQSQDGGSFCSPLVKFYQKGGDNMKVTALVQVLGKVQKPWKDSEGSERISYSVNIMQDLNNISPSELAIKQSCLSLATSIPT